MIHFYPSGDRHDFRIEQQKRQEETTFAKYMMRQSRYVGPCSLRDRSFVLFLYRTECFVISAEVVSGRFVDWRRLENGVIRFDFMTMDAEKTRMRALLCHFIAYKYILVNKLYSS